MNVNVYCSRLLILRYSFTMGCFLILGDRPPPTGAIKTLLCKRQPPFDLPAAFRSRGFGRATDLAIMFPPKAAKSTIKLHRNQGRDASAKRDAQKLFHSIPRADISPPTWTFRAFDVYLYRHQIPHCFRRRRNKFPCTLLAAETHNPYIAIWDYFYLPYLQSYCNECIGFN